jgi:hypothetical protein
MEEKQCGTEAAKKKGWFGKLLEKLDKKMEEKSRGGCCCGPKDPKKGSSCC